MKNTIIVNGKRKVCRVFDSGENGPIDRYTIAFKGYRLKNYGIVYPYLVASDRPFHSMGFGQHGESEKFLTGRNLGKRVDFDSLPTQVKTFILDNI